MKENGTFGATLENEKYFVEITFDYAYTVGSCDNRKYDYVVNPKGLGRNGVYKAVRVSVEGIKSLEIALIVECYFCKADFAFLEDDTLTVLQNDAVTQINLETEEIVCRELDIYGTALSIHRLSDGYLIYGDYAVLKLDNGGNTVWKFSGRDAFVSISGEKSFEITADKVKLRDFEDNYYELDFDGNVIAQILQD